MASSNGGVAARRTAITGTGSPRGHIEARPKDHLELRTTTNQAEQGFQVKDRED